MSLKDAYSYDELKKIYQDNRESTASNSAFFSMMRTAGVDENTLFRAFDASTDGERHTQERKISNRLRDFTEKFNAFYRQEKITIDFKIDARIAKQLEEFKTIVFVKSYSCLIDKSQFPSHGWNVTTSLGSRIQ